MASGRMLHDLFVESVDFGIHEEHTTICACGTEKLINA